MSVKFVLCFFLFLETVRFCLDLNVVKPFLNDRMVAFIFILVIAGHKITALELNRLKLGFLPGESQNKKC